MEGCTVLAETKNQMHITFSEYVPSLHWLILRIIGILTQLHFLGHQGISMETVQKGKPEFMCLNLLFASHFRIEIKAGWRK